MPPSGEGGGFLQGKKTQGETNGFATKSVKVFSPSPSHTRELPRQREARYLLYLGVGKDFSLLRSNVHFSGGRLPPYALIKPRVTRFLGAVAYLIIYRGGFCGGFFEKNLRGDWGRATSFAEKTTTCCAYENCGEKRQNLAKKSAKMGLQTSGGCDIFILY